MKKEELRITEFCPICGQESACTYVNTEISAQGQVVVLTLTFICKNCGTTFELEERQIE